MVDVLVTGASGFIGAALVEYLSQRGLAVRGAYRAGVEWPNGVRVGDINGGTYWGEALAGVATVVHLAGPAHARFSAAPLRTHIVDATENLAAQAEAAGVRRFVYVSSIKAACARTADRAADENVAAQPEDAYGRAKLAAERAVLSRTGFQSVILRPPLVFAPDAKANFARLSKLAATGLPLPFKGVANQRSLISRASLLDALEAALREGAPTGVFHIADRPSLSTPDIVAALCEGMERSARMFSAPVGLLPRALTESLAVNDDRFRGAYGEAWSRDARAALIACGRSFKQRET